jgi:hypothetical protein
MGFFVLINYLLAKKFGKLHSNLLEMLVNSYSHSDLKIIVILTYTSDIPLPLEFILGQLFTEKTPFPHSFVLISKLLILFQVSLHGPGRRRLLVDVRVGILLRGAAAANGTARN